jgi:hypothetical protein
VCHQDIHRFGDLGTALLDWGGAPGFERFGSRVNRRLSLLFGCVRRIGEDLSCRRVGDRECRGGRHDLPVDQHGVRLRLD